MKKNKPYNTRLLSLHSLDQKNTIKKGSKSFDTAIEGLGVSSPNKNEKKKKEVPTEN